MGNVKAVLLIEDTKFDQFFFIHALTDITNATLLHVANNGREALHKLEDRSMLPDLIFTDINMPVMDGIECISKIVNNPQIKHIPVIVLSSDTSVIKTVREIGAKAFIKKPNDNGILRKQLEHVINIDLVADTHMIDHSFLAGISLFLSERHKPDIG